MLCEFNFFSFQIPLFLTLCYSEAPAQATQSETENGMMADKFPADEASKTDGTFEETGVSSVWRCAFTVFNWSFNY